MLKSTLFFIILISSLSNSTKIFSQVRIGSSIPPSRGAMLDINANLGSGTKGFMLPRVKLNDLSSLVNIDPNNTNRPDPVIHTGLVVYGIVDENGCIPLTSGVYLWTGEKWDKLGDNTPVCELQLVRKNKQNFDLIYDYDQEGNIIVAQEYGSAGVWMVHNLAVSRFADGTPIEYYKGSSSDINPQYTYPNTTYWGDQPSTYQSQQGYLYNWYAASKNSNVVVDQRQMSCLDETPGENEVEAFIDQSGNKYLQGICPDGWHLPSEREWTELSKELFINPNHYSDISDTEIDKQKWSSSWESNLEAGEIGYMSYNSPAAPGVGSVYKDPCKIIFDDNSIPNTNGLSKKMRSTGFNVQMTGFTTEDLNANFGYAAYFWTASANNNHAYFRSFSTEINGINKSTADKKDLFSVRCKRDN